MILNRIKGAIEKSKKFEFTKGSLPKDEELIIAYGGILLSIAGADGDYAPEEVKEVFYCLEGNFNISEEEAHDMLEQANQTFEQQGDISSFIKTLNSNYDTNVKVRLLSLAYKVIQADGELEAEEKHTMEKIKNMLILQKEDYERATEAVRQGLI